tara:strand:+ start:327 stop:551 length:225 start_codon:yes stop_codon:yes gene_type:complete
MSKHSGFPDNWDEEMLEMIKAMAASILSVSQAHDDPVFKSGGVFVEEHVDEDYDLVCKLNYIITIRFFVGGKLK